MVTFSVELPLSKLANFISSYWLSKSHFHHIHVFAITTLFYQVAIALSNVMNQSKPVFDKMDFVVDGS